MDELTKHDKGIIRQALQCLANKLGDEVTTLHIKNLSEGKRPVMLDIQIAKLKDCIRLINKF